MSRPSADGEPCLCLVAMTGDLRINGFFGRLIGPFVRSDLGNMRIAAANSPITTLQ